MKCEYCGESCTLCAPNSGCVRNFKVGNGYKFTTTYPANQTLYSPQAPTTTFQTPISCKDPRCSSCTNLDAVAVPGSPFLQCDSCYKWVNFFEVGKQSVLPCQLCNSNIPQCLQCDNFQPSICLACSSGYYLDKLNNKCVQCAVIPGCTRCLQNQCLECQRGYAINALGTCSKCDLADFNKNYFANQIRCTQCQTNNLNQCQYCDIGFLDSKRSPQTCELTCDDGQYPNVTYVEVNNNVMLNQTQCKSCDSSCATCAGQLAQDCLSCPSTSYFNLLSQAQLTGQCLLKISSQPTQLLEIFVTNIITSSAQIGRGTIDDPVTDFQYALKLAQEMAQRYSVTVPISIYLSAGNHFALRNGFNNFNRNNINKNQNYELLITSCAGCGQVTIYNKNKELFQINVPQSLTLKNVVIDSLDSILINTSETCVKNRQICCEIINEQVITVAATPGSCESAMASLKKSHEHNCSVNMPRTLLSMQTGADLKEPNLLTIVDSEIRNVFYAMNSLIKLNPSQGHVVIKNSVFHHLSLCGGIVKNTFTNNTIPQIQLYTNSLAFTQNQMKSFVERRSLETTQWTPSLPCTHAACFNITITKSTFRQVTSLLQNQKSFQLVSQLNGLQFQGLILNLDNFQGPINLTYNTFQNNLMPYDTCDVATPEIKENLNNFNQQSNAQSKFDKGQLASLIQIQNHQNQINIEHNTFNRNVMTAGLIRITSIGATKIAHNNFIHNTAIQQQNVMTIRQCNGLLVDRNTFTQNIGCPSTGGVLLQCPTGFSYQSMFDQYVVSNMAPTASSVTSRHNVYYNNFIGNQQQVLSIEGFANVTMENDTFKNNENYLPQAFVSQSPMYGQVTPQEFQSRTNTNNYMVRGQSTLKIINSKAVSLNSMNFESNWILDDYSQLNQHQSIVLIQNVTGLLNITNSSWSNHKGSILSIIANIQNLGFQSNLLLLSNCIVDQFIFDHNTFFGNTGSMGTLQRGQVQPQLFYFDQTIFNQQQITVNHLKIQSNTMINSESAMTFKVRNLVLMNPEILYNQVNNCVISLLYMSSSAQVIFKNGNVVGNQVQSRAAIIATEAAQGTFLQRFSFTEPKIANLYFESMQFGQNTGQQLTSVLQIYRSQTNYTYTWFTLVINQSKFTNNQGITTNELYFTKSMVFNVTITNCDWNIAVDNVEPRKMAQVLYKDDSTEYLTVSNSQFYCQGQIYNSKIVMLYDIQKTEGRCGLFRIEEPSQSVVQPVLNANPTQFQGNGTLNAMEFRNQFSNNQYSHCNNVRRGAVYFLEKGARVNEVASSFQQNSALEGGVAYITGDGTYLAISNLTWPYFGNQYAYYGGVIFANDGATAHITNATQLSLSTAFEGVLAYLQNRARLLVVGKQTQITNNVVRRRGIVSAYSGSQFWIQNFIVTDTKNLFDSSVIFAQGCRELYSLVNGDTQKPFGQSNLLKSYLIDVRIERQTATYGRLISVTDSRLLMFNVNFTQIDSIYDVNFGLYALDADIEISNSTFFGQLQNSNRASSFNTILFQQKLKNVNGGFISLYGLSTLNLKYSHLKLARGTLGGCIAVFGPSNVTIQNTNFLECAAMKGGAIYADGFNKMSVDKSTFGSTRIDSNLAYGGYGQNIFALGSTSQLTIQNSQFTSYHNSVYFKGQSLTVQNCIFQGDNSTNSVVFGLSQRSDGGGLYIQEAIQVLVKNTWFGYLESLNGGAVYISETTNSDWSLLQQTQSQYSVSFQHVTVYNCTAQYNGGAFLVQNTQQAQISHYSKIYNSFAKGQGGGIAFLCDKKLQSNCNLRLSSILFTNCKADVGGGISWNYVEPSMEARNQTGQFVITNTSSNYVATFGSMEFRNCNAVTYGTWIAGVPQHLVCNISKFDYLDYFTRNTDKFQIPRRLDTENFCKNLTYKNVTSGGQIPSTYYAVIDKYGQVVSNLMTAQLQYNKLGDLKGQNGVTTNIEGVKTFISAFGVFNVSNMIIKSEPDNLIPGTLTFSGVDIQVPSVNQFLQKKFTKNITNSFQYNISLNLLVRSCQAGESEEADGSCRICSEGTFLLNAPTKPNTPCQSCNTEKMVCMGGSNVGPRQGFWRKNITSSQFLNCYESNACLGYNTSVPALLTNDYNRRGLCNVTAGYYGTLCSGCLPGFKRVGSFQCSQCAQYEYAYQAAALIGILGAIIYFVNLIIKGAVDGNPFSYYLKILFNHMQMIIITSSFNLQWPEYVKYVFKIGFPIQEFYSSLISFDCFLNTDQLDPDPSSQAYQSYVYNSTADASEFRILYKKLIIISGMPVFICIVSYLAWWVILKIQKKEQDLNAKFTATFIFVLYLVHPFITQSVIDMFNCKDYDGDYRLVTDLQVICFKGFHNYLSYGLALPCILIWGVGIPAAIFIIMRKESEMLETTSCKQKFGFLYNGFKRQNYFWEIIIMYRKIFCIFIAVFLTNLGVIVQALILLIVLFIFQYANNLRKPYADRALNDLENMSLVTQIVTIYCGLFFVSSKNPNSASFNENTDFYLDEDKKMAFVILIAVCNFAFIVLWFHKYIEVMRGLIKEKYPKLYVYLFLCGRDDKMQMETAKRARNSKKETIIECIEGIMLHMGKMKGMYENQIFYEDHNRFLRLLYYIESEKLQIDVREKKHNYYIQGDMYRLRKFDPETIKEQQNKAELRVPQNVERETVLSPEQQQQYEETILSANQFMLKQMSTTQFVKDFRKLQQLQISQKQQKINTVQPADIENVAKKLNVMKAELIQGQITGSQDDFERDEDDDGFQFDKSQLTNQTAKTKKKRKKPNVADLSSVYQKTRQNAFQVKHDKKSRVNLNDLDMDGRVIQRFELPQFLKGFKNIYEQDSVQESERAHSVGSQIRIMRKLTERVQKEHQSPEKSNAKQQDYDSDTNVNSVMPSDVTGVTDLKVFDKNKEENDGKLIQASKLIMVTKGDGQELPKKIYVEEDAYKQLRQKRGPRVEYKEEDGNGIVVEHAAISIDREEELEITIFEEDVDLIQRSKKKTEPSTEQQLPVNEVEKQSSFRTDSSMRDYDLQQDVEVPQKKSQLFQRQTALERNKEIDLSEQAEIKPQTSQLFERDIGIGLGVFRQQLQIDYLSSSNSDADLNNSKQQLDFYGLQAKSRNI